MENKETYKLNLLQILNGKIRLENVCSRYPQHKTRRYDSFVQRRSFCLGLDKVKPIQPRNKRKEKSAVGN